MLWAVCELLLPTGRQQQLTRMTVSVLVMTALLSTAGDLLDVQPQGRPALVRQAAQISEDHYRETVIRTAANQTAAYCERFFSKAGCTAQATAFFTLDGAVEHIEIILDAPPALMTAQEAAELLARQLGMTAENIWISAAGAERK